MATILLAEDDDSLRQFMTATLQKAGHNVTACADGLEALTALQNAEKIDLLLTDIVMPGLDGTELAARALKITPALKVLFITGFAAMAADAENIPAQGGRVVAKPFHLGKLLAEVEALLQK